MAETVKEYSETIDYGLRRDAVSPMEALAQSVSTIAPTTTPAATIPLVCALAGNGTWLAYALATVAVVLVASQNQFYNQFPVVGTPPTPSSGANTFYNPPSGLGVVNKTIGSPRQIQMTLRVEF